MATLPHFSYWWVDYQGKIYHTQKPLGTMAGGAFVPTTGYSYTLYRADGSSAALTGTTLLNVGDYVLGKDDRGIALPKMTNFFKNTKVHPEAAKEGEAPVAVLTYTPNTAVTTTTDITWSYENSTVAVGSSVVSAEWKLDDVAVDSLPINLEAGRHKVDLRVKDSRGAWSEWTSQTVPVLFAGDWLVGTNTTGQTTSGSLLGGVFTSSTAKRGIWSAVGVYTMKTGGQLSALLHLNDYTVTGDKDNVYLQFYVSKSTKDMSLIRIFDGGTDFVVELHGTKQLVRIPKVDKLELGISLLDNKVYINGTPYTNSMFNNPALPASDMVVFEQGYVDSGSAVADVCDISYDTRNVDLSKVVSPSLKPTAQITYTAGRADLRTDTAITWSSAGSTDAHGKSIVATEWKLDSNAVTATPNGAVTTAGLHTMYMRVKNTDGIWSDWVQKEFAVGYPTTSYNLNTNGVSGTGNPANGGVVTSTLASSTEFKYYGGYKVADYADKVTTAIVINEYSVLTGSKSNLYLQYYLTYKSSHVNWMGIYDTGDAYKISLLSANTDIYVRKDKPIVIAMSLANNSIYINGRVYAGTKHYFAGSFTANQFCFEHNYANNATGSIRTNADAMGFITQNIDVNTLVKRQ